MTEYIVQVCDKCGHQAKEDEERYRFVYNKIGQRREVCRKCYDKFIVHVEMFFDENVEMIRNVASEGESRR